MRNSGLKVKRNFFRTVEGRTGGRGKNDARKGGSEFTLPCGHRVRSTVGLIESYQKQRTGMHLLKCTDYLYHLKMNKYRVSIMLELTPLLGCSFPATFVVGSPMLE
jgi:hypothetical protein